LDDLMPAATAHLVVDGVSRSFGELKANDRVTLAATRGSVHAVLGENGAGKTTLMNILYGLYQPDEGRILVDGRPVVINSPRAALAQGIGMVHQHFMLIGPLTVAENVILGLEGGLRLDLGRHMAKLAELSRSFGFDIDPREPVWRLPMGSQQRVEILKLLYRDADILILDEPTSVLTPSEVGPFLDLLRRLKAGGKTILLITHKLEEVMAVADRVTVMRAGRVVAEAETAHTTPRELARLMVGRDVVFEIERTGAMIGRPVLEVADLRVENDRGLAAVDGITLSVAAGEILGIAGVDGNGQAELAEAIAGLRTPMAGRVLIDGTDVTQVSVADRLHRHGLGYVPEDRQRTGLVLDTSVAANMMLRSYREPPFARRGLLDFGAIRTHAAQLAQAYDVRLQSVDQQARYLSGGNQQKVILAREIERAPKVLVVAQPCKGLDVGAIEFVQRTLLQQRKNGVGILYISTELEHILMACDRIAVIAQGRITGILTPAEATGERLGLLMAGSRAGHA
jgi:general nucleoside transport system ATP-binding protein